MQREHDDLTARASARLGSVLCGKYRLDRVLGIGGMASVYSATHQRNEDRVAVKILHPEIAVDRVLRERFLREGYAANSVGHPGTVRVIDDDVAKDGSVFLVMDLLEGETLDARWERSGRRLSVGEVVRLMAELLAFLEAAHAKGITHRDLKPENLFLTRDGRLRILDFGVARLREASPSRTKSGAVFGTPAFMPPEQAIGRVKEVDAISDLWAVGGTAFTLLSGRYVHDAETAEEMLIYAATKSAPLLASAAPLVPADIAAVFDRALRFEKKDRWQSARQMREALQGTAAWSGASTADDWEDINEQTRLAPPPQMTVPLAVTGQGATVDMPTVRGSTIGGVATTGKRREWRVSRTLVAVGGVSSALFLASLAIAILVVAPGAHREKPSRAASAFSEFAFAPPSSASSLAPAFPTAATVGTPTGAPAVSAAPATETSKSRPPSTTSPTPAPPPSSPKASPASTRTPKRDPLAP
jgi:serine/threonine protein kinase